MSLEVYWTGFAEDRNRWMDQLDKEVNTPPPRPKIVVETGDGLVVAGSAARAQGRDRQMKRRMEERKAESAHGGFVRRGCWRGRGHG